MLLDDITAAARAAGSTLLGMAASPVSPLYWGFLLSAVAVAAGAYGLRDCWGRPTLRGFVRYAFPGYVWLHRSSRTDRRFALVDATLGSALLAPWIVSSAVVAYGTAGVLERVFGAAGPQWPPVFAGQLALALALLLAADLGFFAAHWLCHRVPLLWEFHKVHHSAQVLTPLTALRVHPVQRWLTQTLQGAGTGLALGLFDYGFGYALDPAGFVGANVFSFLFYAAGANLQHSHVWISFGPTFSKIFVSPAQHQIHHSRHPAHRGKNLGAVFAIWDTMAGTLVVPGAVQRLSFGLEGGEERAYQGVLQLYFVPFARASQWIARWFRALSKRRTDIRTQIRLVALIAAVSMAFSLGVDARARAAQCGFCSTTRNRSL